MTRTNKPHSAGLTGLAVVLLTASLLVTFPRSAHADKTSAFIGGLIGGHVLTNMGNRAERRTRAAEEQAYSQQPAPAPAPAAAAPSSSSSVEDRLATLDKLAANGTMTKEEYQQRRKAIIDGI
jgi:hypothetical protein